MLQEVIGRPLGMAPDLAPSVRPRGMCSWIENGQFTALQAGDKNRLKGVEGTLLVASFEERLSMTCAGIAVDRETSGVYMFCVPKDLIQACFIAEWFVGDDSPTILLQSPLLDLRQGVYPTDRGYQLYYHIDASVVSGHLLWTDGLNRPGCIDIAYLKNQNSLNYEVLTLEEITLAKRPPLLQPVVFADIAGAALTPNYQDDGEGYYKSSLAFSQAPHYITALYIFQDGQKSSIAPWSEPVWSRQFYTSLAIPDASYLYNSQGQRKDVTTIEYYARQGVDGAAFRIAAIELPEQLTVAELSALQNIVYSTVAVQSPLDRKAMSGPSLPTINQNTAFYAVPDKANALEVVRNRPMLGGYSSFDTPSANGSMVVTLTSATFTRPVFGGPFATKVPNVSCVKQGAKFSVGLVFKDKFGRPSYVSNITPVDVPLPAMVNEEIVDTGSTFNIKEVHDEVTYKTAELALSVTPPAGTQSVSVVVKNTEKLTSFFQTWARFLFWHTEADGTDVFCDSISSDADLVLLNRKFIGVVFILGGTEPYTFEVGQRINLYDLFYVPSNASFGPFTPPTNPLRQLTIHKAQGSLLYCKLSKADAARVYQLGVGDVDSISPVYSSYRIEVCSYATTDQPWIETHSIPCTPLEPLSATVSLNNAYIASHGEGPPDEDDEYEREVDIVLEQVEVLFDSADSGSTAPPANVGVTRIELYSPLESATPIDVFSGEWNRRNGFTVAERPPGQQPRGFGEYPSSVIWGNAILAGTSVNGLGEFLTTNRQDFSRENGKITGLIQTGDTASETNVLLAIGERGVASCYIGVIPIKQKDGSTIFAGTEDLISSHNNLNGRYGTAHPGSVFGDTENRVYFWDKNQGGFVRYGGDGLTALGAASEFRSVERFFKNAAWAMGWAGRFGTNTEAVMVFGPDASFEDNAFNAMAFDETLRQLASVRLYKSLEDAVPEASFVVDGVRYVVAGSRIWAMEGDGENKVLGRGVTTRVSMPFYLGDGFRAKFESVVLDGTNIICPTVDTEVIDNIGTVLLNTQSGKSVYGIRTSGGLARIGSSIKVNIEAPAGGAVGLLAAKVKFTPSLGGRVS